MELGNDWGTEFAGAEAMNTKHWTLRKNQDYEKMALDTMLNKLRERKERKLYNSEADFY